MLSWVDDAHTLHLTNLTRTYLPKETLTDVHKEPKANTLTELLCVLGKTWANSAEKMNVIWFGGEALAWEVTRKQNLARPVCVLMHWGEVGMSRMCEQGL